MYESAGFEVSSYTYYNGETGKLEFDSILQTMKDAPRSSIFILHTCAHNPSGCDPSQEQWRQIAEIMRDRNLFPVFDSAYLGMTSGSYDEDAYPIHYFVREMKLEVAICLSFAKNMGLYGTLRV